MKTNLLIILFVSIAMSYNFYDDVRIQKRKSSSAGGSLTVDSSVILSTTNESTSPDSFACFEGDKKVKAVSSKIYVDTTKLNDSLATKAPLLHGVASGYISHANTDSTLDDSTLHWQTKLYGDGSLLRYGKASSIGPDFQLFNGSTGALAKSRISFFNKETAYGFVDGRMAMDWVKLTAGADAGYNKFRIRTIPDPSPETYIDHLVIMEETGQMIFNDTIHGAEPRTYQPIWIRNESMKISALEPWSIVTTDADTVLYSTGATWDTSDNSMDLPGDVGVGGDVIIQNDNSSVKFGNAQDAEIYYSGSHLIVEPKLVGTGMVRIGADRTGALRVANIGLDVLPDSKYGIYENNASFSTASDAGSIFLRRTKIAGATDYRHSQRGFYLDFTYNQPGGNIGNFRPLYCNSTIDDGDVGDASNSRSVYTSQQTMVLNGGKVWGDVYGQLSYLEQNAGSEVTGDIYGNYVNADYVGTVGGTVYGSYLNEVAGVDFGFYQDGVAPNVFGGDVRIESDSNGVLLGNGQDAEIKYNDTNLVYNSQLVGSGDHVFEGGFLRADSARYRRYYHLPIAGLSPGASGATWTSASANNLAGWQLNAASETLEFGSDVHSDWDSLSDLSTEIYFQLLASGSPADEVHLQLTCYYMGTGDVATKTQVIIDTIVTDGTQYKMYESEIAIDFDFAGNVVEKGDHFSFELILVTGTSDIDDVLITAGSFNYNTTHVGLEDGDT